MSYAMPVKASQKVSVGDRYYRLTVIGLIKDTKNPKALCLCDCGRTVTPQRGALKNGRAKSCGCFRVETFLAHRAASPRLSEEEVRRRRNEAIDRWHKAHKETNRKASRRHYANNKEKVKSYHHVRRARLKKARIGEFDSRVEQRLMRLQRGRCAVCQSRLDVVGHHVDHIHPISRGGAHENKNLQLLCPTCNLSKGARDPLSFMQTRGFLL